MNNQQEPIAWAVMQPDSYSVFISYDKAVVHRDNCAGGDIVPLFIITDEEHDAIRWFAYEVNVVGSNKSTQKHADTLRNMLRKEQRTNL